MQTAYLLDGASSRVLVDCGVTTLLGLEQAKLSDASITHIVISHLHGDHFGGLVWFLMHATFVLRRTTPLDIYGPVGIEARVTAAFDVLYPGVQESLGGFEVRYHEMHADMVTNVGGIDVTPFVVLHPSGAPSHALRFEENGRVLAFSGDSEWTEALVIAGKNADLYLMECYKFEGNPVMHLSWKTIQQHLDRIGCKRIVLTHMSQEMLDRRGEVHDGRIAFGEDGAVFDV